MIVVPLQAQASQVVTVTLGGQDCRISVYEKKAYTPASTRLNVGLGNGVSGGYTLDIADGSTPLLLDVGDGTPAALSAFPMLYFALTVADTVVVTGVPCLAFVPLVRSIYLGFVGELAFWDLQGLADPVASGLGTRWVLGYLDG